MTTPLQGRSALVTGGSRGIGAAIATRLAADGAAVTLTYGGSRDAANDVVRAIQEAGGTARAIAADARQPGASAAAVTDALQHQGGLDIVVSNAGINIIEPLPNIADESYDAPIVERPSSFSPSLSSGSTKTEIELRPSEYT